MQTITIVDYGMGNLRSVAKAFEKAGARLPGRQAGVVVTDSPAKVKAASKLVLPGVGAFTAAVRELEKRRLVDAIKKKISAGTPYLGLCLGLQLLFEESEENEGKKKARGFGIIPGKVRRFRVKLKVPHMGWNTLKLKKKDCPLFKGMGPRDHFYFVHSYYGAPKNGGWESARTSYGVDFCSAVWKDHVFATQFHPEKSQAAGLRLLENFIRYRN